ncbi:hypothetical protein DVH05_005929 [Phytophthora capsici]|nr:hypothetical protein DVH05_008433 [Phytophthora capsici]KAG1686784.1 hypothetical protein DVH05_005929 [Phytophthora capsici]
MVLTRSQARAAAQELPDITEVAVSEMHDEEILAVVPASTAVRNVCLESQVSRIVDNFWSETQRLAAETTLLQNNQAQQAQEYQAALTAIHHDARSSTAELAAHQQWIESQIGKALQDTKVALQQELQVVAHAQAAANDSSRLFIQEQLQSVRGAADREALEMKNNITAQAAKIERVEREMSMAITNAHSSLAQRINDVLSRPQTTIDESQKGQMEEMLDEMQAKIDMKFQQMTTNIVENCIAKLEERGGVTNGRMTIRRVQKLVSEYVANQEEKMENKVSHLVQSAHSQLSKEMANTFEKLENKMNDSVRQQVHDESTATELRMENRIRDILQKAHEERTIELGRQMEATHAVEEKLERTRSELGTDVQKMKARLDGLEKQMDKKVPITIFPPKRRIARGIEKHVHDLVKENKRVQDERVDRMEQYVQAELRRVLQVAPKVNATKPPGKSGPVQSRPKKEHIPAPHRSTKVKRAIDQAQKAVKHRSELAARRYDALYKD